MERTTTGAPVEGDTVRGGQMGYPRIAYVMSRFPKLTETFVLFEIVALRDEGYDVEVFPLLRERESIMHAEAEGLARDAHYLPFLSFAIIASQVHHLLRHPRRYLGALGAVIGGTWGSWNFMGGGLAIFPKVAHMARLMESGRIAHVHCHFANHPALAGFVIHRLTGIPYSFTAHGSDLHVDRTMLCTKVAEAAFVVPISNFNRNVIAGECGTSADDRLVVIHTGVDTTHFQPRPARGAQRPFTIVCVGTLHEVKGQVHLVNACARLAKAGTPFICHLVGEGPDRPMLERRIADLDLTDRVVLAGSMDREALAGLLATADVLAAPSVPTGQGKREGIPVVLMEAMSSGLPVVASRLSGIPELVSDDVSGLLVEPGDVAGLADALTRLEQDPALRDRLADAGRRTVLADFDIRRNALRLANEIVSRSGGHARRDRAATPPAPLAEEPG